MKIMAGIATTIQQGCCCCSPIHPHLLEACGLETAEINNLPPLLGDSLEDLGYCSHLSWQILQCHTNWEWCRRVSNLTQTGAMNMDIIIIINTKGWIHQELMIIIRKARDHSTMHLSVSCPLYHQVLNLQFQPYARPLRKNVQCFRLSKCHASSCDWGNSIQLNSFCLLLFDVS